MRDLFVVVSGAPGSGKTTLARPLAVALDLPLFEKDVIKEALGDSIGAESLEESRKLGAAANEVLHALARTNRSGVFESAWLPEFVRPRFEALGRALIEVFCDVPVELAMQRYEARRGRHWSHYDAERANHATAWATYAVPIGGKWPVFRVDTTKPVDIDALVARLLAE